MINWEVVIWTCITLGILLGTISLILILISSRNIKNKKSELKDFHLELKSGMKVILCGSIYGTVTQVKGDIVEVEVAKNVVLLVSRYAIQKVG